MIKTPEIYPDIPEHEYHADPVAVPSLSSSIAKVLLEQTPKHAAIKHRRLPLFVENAYSARKIDIGSAAHKMMLGKGAEIYVIDADSYRSKAAAAARDKAIADGLIPMLGPDFSAACGIVEATTISMRNFPECDRLFKQEFGKPEAVLIWQDIAGPWCRAMLDWTDLEDGVIWDIKTTAAGLSDKALKSRIADGWDVSAAFYIRGLTQLRPELAGRVKFRWICIEQSAPYEMRIIEADATTITIGDRKAAMALEIWRQCMETGDWPGYSRQIEKIEYPAWEENRWIEREMTDDNSLRMVTMDRAPINKAAKPLVYGP